MSEALQGAVATRNAGACCPRHSNVVRDLRKFICAELPTYGSLIGLELLMLIFEHELRGKRLRLKDLHLELGRSPGAVRRLCRDLMSDNWIDAAYSERDGRVRLVVPAPRLLALMSRFREIGMALHCACQAPGGNGEFPGFGGDSASGKLG